MKSWNGNFNVCVLFFSLTYFQCIIFVPVPVQLFQIQIFQCQSLLFQFRFVFSDTVIFKVRIYHRCYVYYLLYYSIFSLCCSTQLTKHILWGTCRAIVSMTEIKSYHPSTWPRTSHQFHYNKPLVTKHSVVSCFCVKENVLHVFNTCFHMMQHVGTCKIFDHTLRHMQNIWKLWYYKSQHLVPPCNHPLNPFEFPCKTCGITYEM